MSAEYLCPSTGLDCPIGKNIADMERLVSAKDPDRYKAVHALKTLVLMKRHRGNCTGPFTEASEDTDGTIATHCGLNNLPEIIRIASAVGDEFDLEPELYTGISTRKFE